MELGEVEKVLAVLAEAGWKPQPGWFGAGVCYSDPVNTKPQPTPEEITRSLWPSPTFTSLRQIIIVNDTIFYRHSAAPWVGASIYEVSGDRAVALVRQEQPA